MQYFSLGHRTLLSLPDTSTTKHHFHFGPAISFFLKLSVIALHSSPESYWTPSDLRASSSSAVSFCFSILFGFYGCTFIQLYALIDCCSVAQSCSTLCDPTDCSTPGLPILHHLPNYAQVHVHCIGDASNHLILRCPLLLLPSILPSIKDFSNESAVCIR